MTPFTRWLRFNAVGAVGILVQLSTLFLLNRILPGRYLIASAAAVEITILHNFLWHLHYTWKDRRHTLSPFRSMLRFSISNGLVSLSGNLVIMRCLVHECHVPVLAANAAAIACCSLANFFLANLWAFSTGDSRHTGISYT